MPHRRVLVVSGLGVLLAAVTVVAFELAHSSVLAQEPTWHEPPPRILVATETIEAGTPIDAAMAHGSVALRPTPAPKISAGAIGSVEPVRGKLAVRRITKGEQLVVMMFAAPSSMPGPSRSPR